MTSSQMEKGLRRLGTKVAGIGASIFSAVFSLSRRYKTASPEGAYRQAMKDIVEQAFVAAQKNVEAEILKSENSSSEAVIGQADVAGEAATTYQKLELERQTALGQAAAARVAAAKYRKLGLEMETAQSREVPDIAQLMADEMWRDGLISENEYNDRCAAVAAVKDAFRKADDALRIRHEARIRLKKLGWAVVAAALVAVILIFK